MIEIYRFAKEIQDVYINAFLIVEPPIGFSNGTF